jgi:lipopolysaccharide/colanic/teichoic acid biosynthesis glycosyltransferase
VREQLQGLPKIYSEEQLRAIIEHECALTHRTGNEFSLLVFNVEDSDHVLVSKLIRTLTSRMRSTDEIGWLAKHRIAVVLPYTTPDSGSKLAEDICGLIEKGISQPSYTVYAYPSQWPFNSTDHRGRRSGESDPSSGRDNSPIGDSSTSMTAERGSWHSVKLLLIERLPTWKRVMDISGASLGLILLSPVLLLVVLLIKTVSPGPVIFRQIRVGHGGKLFWVYKFRTMVLDADASVHRQRLNQLIDVEQPMRKLDVDNDPRMIPFSGILRTFGLDELPQLINVLRGDMSLVGPRPCLPYEAEKYQLWQTQRFDVVPGLTGLWQVSGKNRTTFKEMMRLDINYARNSSFLLDVKIILMTMPALIAQASDFFLGKVQGETSGERA